MKNLLRVPLLAIFTMAALGSAGAERAPARIAVAAASQAADAQVSKVAARAPYVLIFDAEGQLLQSHANPVAKNPGGAGPALARWLDENNVQTLAAGEFGSSLADALAERKIAAVKASGPAAAAARGAKR